MYRGIIVMDIRQKIIKSTVILNSIMKFESITATYIKGLKPKIPNSCC